MMRTPSPSPPSLHAIWTLSHREWLANLRSPGVYVAAVLAALVVSYLLNLPLRFLHDFGLLVSEDPLIPALLGAVAIAALYTTVAAVNTLVTERERQTLPVLFYTPLNHRVLVLGKFLGVLLSGLAVTFMILIFVVVASWTTGFAIDLQIFWIALLSLLLLADMTAFGLLVSAYASSTRSAIFAALLILLLLFGVQIAGRLLEQFVPLVRAELLAYLLPLLDATSTIAAIVSPLAYLLRGLDAVSAGQWSGYLLALSSSLIYTVLLLLLAVRVSTWRGATP